MMVDDGVGIWMGSWEFNWLGFHLMYCFVLLASMHF